MKRAIFKRGLKYCYKCQKFRKKDNFFKNKINSHGLNSNCKPCVRKNYNEYRGRNIEIFRKRGREKQRKFRETQPAKFLWLAMLSRAKQRGEACKIKLEDIVIPARCPVLGIEIFLTPYGSERKKENRDNAPSIDRIDNSVGYVRGNIIVVSHRANRIKNDATADELKKLAEFYGALSVRNSKRSQNRKPARCR